MFPLPIGSSHGVCVSVCLRAAACIVIKRFVSFSFFFVPFVRLNILFVQFCTLDYIYLYIYIYVIIYILVRACVLSSSLLAYFFFKSFFLFLFISLSLLKRVLDSTLPFACFVSASYLTLLMYTSVIILLQRSRAHDIFFLCTLHVCTRARACVHVLIRACL